MKLRNPVRSISLLLVCIWCHSGLWAADPVSRQWTSKAGSKIDAVLVNYDDANITLRTADGALRAIPAEQLSAEDVAYARTYSSLKQETAPWVTLSAKTGAAGRSRATGGIEQKKALDIQVENKAKAKASVDLIWLMLGKDIETKEEVVVDFGIWKGELNAGETKDLRTPESTTTFSDGRTYYSYYGGYYYYSTYYYPSGSEMTSFIVQARWKDQVLASTTGASSDRIKKVAGSNDIVAGLTDAGFKVDSALADKIRKGLSGRPGS